MTKVKCPNCGNEVKIDIAEAVDEFGEEFCCSKCGFIFRYVEQK